MATKKITKSEQEMLKFHHYLRRFATFSAKLPWWFGFTCAAITYLYFNFYFPQTMLADPSSALLLRIVDDMLHRAAITNLISGSLIGMFALMSVFASVKEFKRQGGLGGDDGTDTLFVLTTKAFIAEVTCALVAEGYSISRPKRRKSLCDLIAVRGEQRIGVRLADFKIHQIHVSQVEQFVKSGASEDATGLCYITVGGFSKGAVDLASKHGVQLIGRQSIMGFLKREPAQPDPSLPSPSGRAALRESPSGKGSGAPASDGHGTVVTGPRRVRSAVMIPRDSGQLNPNFVMPAAAMNPPPETEE